MARSRNIKPGFFKNEDLAECSLAARLCFAGLWTLADREGRLEDRPKRIKGELFAFDAFDVEPLLVELTKRGFIERYEVDGQRFMQISKFATHQTPHYTEKPSTIKPPGLQESKQLDAAKLPESPAPSSADDSGNTPGATPPLRGGQNPLIPDSLIPDSLIPDSRIRDSDPGGSAAPPPSAPDPKPMTAKDRVWAMGVPLLGASKRSALGKLVAEHGPDLVAEVLTQAAIERPEIPLPWVIATCAARAKQPQPGQRRIDAPPPGSAQALLDREPRPPWVTQAGFPNVWEAENVGCYPHTAHLFREGRKVQ